MAMLATPEGDDVRRDAGITIPTMPSRPDRRTQRWVRKGVHRRVSGYAAVAFAKIDEAEAAVAREVYHDYAAGKSPRAIAATLNARGLAAPCGGAPGQACSNGRGVKSAHVEARVTDALRDLLLDPAVVEEAVREFLALFGARQSQARAARASRRPNSPRSSAEPAASSTKSPTACSRAPP